MDRFPNLCSHRYALYHRVVCARSFIFGARKSCLRCPWFFTVSLQNALRLCLSCFFCCLLQNYDVINNSLNIGVFDVGYATRCLQVGFDA